MPKSLPTLTAALGVCAILAAAQETPTAPATEKIPNAQTSKSEKPAPQKTEQQPAVKTAAKPTAPKSASATTATAPTTTVAPTPTPKPKRLSFFQRLFGSRKRRPTPPSATPTPTPVARIRKVPRNPVATPAPAEPRPSSDRAVAQDPSTSLKLDKPAPPLKPDKAAPAVKPAKDVPVAKLDKPAPTLPPPVKKAGKPLVEPPANADPDVKEKYRFDLAKSKAMDDPHIRSLKAKADDAATEEESRKALLAYNKALYEKMRKIDGSLTERIDRMEAAMVKRLNE